MPRNSTKKSNLKVTEQEYRPFQNYYKTESEERGRKRLRGIGVGPY